MLAHLGDQGGLAHPLLACHQDNPTPALVQVFDTLFEGLELGGLPGQWS
jgi:hypothetical protein